PCTAHLTYVAVDSRLKPVEVPSLAPESNDEERLYNAAQERRELRKARIAARAQMAGDVAFQAPQGPHTIEVATQIFPEDTLIHDFADAGSVMLTLDVTGGILCARYARRVAVTASIDAVDFYSPLMVGEIMVVKAALNWVGRTSMEIGMKVLAENPWQGTLRHTTTAYFTFVAIDDAGKPVAVPPYTPQTEDEKRRFVEGAARRALRLSRAK
ncbi:MAG: hotdog domain-containing protein, partial [bacterium]